MIYTSYFANLKNIPSGIICYSIAGENPKWYTEIEDYRHRTCPRLAPRRTWWNEWHDRFSENPNSDESKAWYSGKYRATVLNGLNADAFVRMLCDHNDNDICLLCYEKPEDFCHRRLVSDWLNENGISCVEFQA